MSLIFNKMIFFTLFFLIFVQLNTAIAQIREPGVTEGNYGVIQQALDQKMGQTYKVIGIVNIDSAQTAESWIFEKPVEDPYGTLTHSYLFLATTRFVGKKENEDSKEPKDRIGIYKDRRILWHSDPLVTPNVFAGGGFYGVLDLNNDKKVEIIITLFSGSKGRTESLWIFSWDGNSAELISSIDEEGRSTIRMRRGLSELIDVEPDGILEIKGEYFDESPVLFSWNGQEYGDWGVTLPRQLPRNAVEADVETRIRQTEEPPNLLTFDYKIFNRTSSLQSIEEFAVKNFSIAPKNVNKPVNWRFNPHVKHRLVSWQVDLFLEQHPEALLEPGESDSSFSFTTTGLPRPATYYVQGNNGDLSLDTGDLINNSVSGTTLGPYNPPDPFDQGIFTDSLRSYTTQACELQWVTNQGICNSLQAKLENVKKQLERGNAQAAGNVLQAFLNEVEAQKDKHLTSEGYGLLYYNAAYFREQLNN